MNTEAKKPEKVETQSENNEPKKIVIAVEIVKPTVWLQFTGLEDVKELIQFTGSKPTVNENGELRIKKYDLSPPCMINVDHVGNIQKVLSPEEWGLLYDVKDTKVFSGSFSAKNK